MIINYSKGNRSLPLYFEYLSLQYEILQRSPIMNLLPPYHTIIINHLWRCVSEPASLRPPAALTSIRILI